MKKTIAFFTFLVPATGLASWHASAQPHAPQATVGDAMVRQAEPMARQAGWRQRAAAGRWTCIVIHHSATEVGGAERFDKAHREKGWEELGYHFVIGNGSDTADGEVEVGPRWIEQMHGAHCWTPSEYYNQHGIGICLVGNFDDHAPSRSQMRSLERLVRFLSREYRIAPSHVYVHGQVTGKTRCPGEHFNLDAIRRAAAR